MPTGWRVSSTTGCWCTNSDGHEPGDRDAAYHRWQGPFDPSLQAQALDALEDGRVLLLDHLPFQVLPQETRLLSPKVMGTERKNISFDLERRQIGNTSLAGTQAEALGDAAPLRRRSGKVAAGSAAPLRAHAGARAHQFPPRRDRRRDYSPRHDDRLLHVDAFPSRPMRGGASCGCSATWPATAHRAAWRVGEPFADFARQFLPRIGRPLPGSAWLLQTLGLTKGRRSEYDRLMLRLHDSGKLDAAYQSQAPKTPTWRSRPAPRGYASPTRCCTPHLPGIARWSRRFICRSPPWSTRNARRCACWNEWWVARWREATSAAPTS